MFMGSMEMPSQSPETFKVPTATYEFGANFLDPKVSSAFDENIYVCVLDMYPFTDKVFLHSACSSGAY